jgi:excinuclease ABC subunit C
MFPEAALSSAPHAPGVYMMLDAKSAVVYVGKAKDLFKRLSSYAHFSGAEYNKTAVMLQKVAKVDTIITGTEKEALILEASLIKKHKPKYNILLRDDKNYPYIKVTVQEKKSGQGSLFRSVFFFRSHVVNFAADFITFPFA